MGGSRRLTAVTVLSKYIAFAVTKRANTHTLHATDSVAGCVECMLTLNQQSTSEGTGSCCHMTTFTQIMSTFKQGWQHSQVAAITYYGDSIYTTAVVTQHLYHNSNIYEQRQLHSYTQ